MEEIYGFLFSLDGYICYFAIIPFYIFNTYEALENRFLTIFLSIFSTVLFNQLHCLAVCIIN